MNGLGQHGSFDFKAPKTGDTVPEGEKQRNRETKLDGLGGQKGSGDTEREDGPLAWYVAKAFQYCEYQ